jgi:hypothetical protein
MTWPFLLIGAVVGALIVLLIQWRMDERATAREWAPLLTPKGAILLEQQKLFLNDGLHLADIAYDRAHTLRELGSMEEARALIRHGYNLMDRFAPDLMSALSMMALYSRMVSAIAPVRPLPARKFHTGSVSALAHFGAIVHRLLVNSAERFRLRLYVIGQAAQLLLRSLSRTTRKLLGRESRPDSRRADWEHMEAIRSDFHALKDETLVTLRVLLESLESEQKKLIAD